MSLVDNIKNILNRHKELNVQLEQELISLEANDMVNENESLKNELTQLKSLLLEEKTLNTRLSKENKGLKNALYEQIYNEKLAILSLVNKKVDVYFRAASQDELNRLKAFEINAKQRIGYMLSLLRESRVDAQDELYFKLDELNKLLEVKVTQAREAYEKYSGAFSQDRNEQFERLHQEGLTENEMNGAIKKNNLESLIGLNVLNVIGILFLIIGVIAVSQYTYYQLPDILKSILIFVGGAVLLVGGELLNRKKANVFSLGITSGGIAVLYVALAFSFFGLKIIDMYPALTLCVIITTLSFVLSKRYNSQTIATFALIGGYIPIFSISGNKTLVYSAMVYFVILNLLAFIISVNKKWTASAFIGFALNVAGTIYIMSIMLWQNSNKPFDIEAFITLLYIIFTFIIYTLIPIAGTYFNKIKLKKADIILMGLNTLISALLMYIAFYSVKLSDFTGILAIVFAGVYLALGRFIETKLTQEKKVRALFYLTGFTFVVLIIPFQFGKLWLSLGWLVEGVALVTYGAVKEDKSFKKYGFIVCGLCLGAFLIFDILFGLFKYDGLFAYKYFAITLGSIIILSAYIYKRCMANKAITVYKYFTAINLWIYMLYLINSEISDVLYKGLKNSHFSSSYLIGAFGIAISFLIAYTIPRIKIIADTVMKVISVIIYTIGILWLIILNSTYTPVYKVIEGKAEIPTLIYVFGSAVLIIISLLSVLAMRDILKYLVMERSLGVEWFPLIISAYFVFVLTHNLIAQYHLEFSSFAISIIYVITALAWIVFGFIKRYAFIRRFGLGLAIMAVAKLFIVDLSFLSEGYRIISYFAFGITLIAISFVYQYFNKRLELYEVSYNDKENSI